MDDTVSRKTAIDALNLADDRGQIHSILDVVDVINSVPPAQQWIPVTPKTMPKKVGDYLVTTNSGQIARYIYMGNGTSKDYWMRCVVAWMPLPAPYRGREEYV